MEIVESFIQGKYADPEKCEDFIAVTDNFACVIDGASNRYGVSIDGKSSGRLAGEVISSAIQKLSPDKDWKEIIGAINDELNDYFKRAGILEYLNSNPRARASAAIGIYNAYRREVCIIADCQCIIGEKRYSCSLAVDEPRVNARALFLEAELKSGKTIEELLENDTGYKYIEPLLEVQWVFRNTTGSQYCYGVIDGQEIPEEFIKVICVPQGIKEIILATDGYPVLKPTLKETEEELNRILKKDPLCIGEFKAFRGVSRGMASFDDRAYIRIRI